MSRPRTEGGGGEGGCAAPVTAPEFATRREPLEGSPRALRLAVRTGKGAGERGSGAEAARGRSGRVEQGQSPVTGEARSRKSCQTAPRPTGHRRSALAGKRGQPPPDGYSAALGNRSRQPRGGKAARRLEQRHLGTIYLIFKDPLGVFSCPVALGEGRAFRPGAAGSRPRGRAPFPAGLVGGGRKGVATPGFPAPRHPPRDSLRRQRVAPPSPPSGGTATAGAPCVSADPAGSPVSLIRLRADSEHGKLLRNSRCWLSLFFKKKNKKNLQLKPTKILINKRLRARRKGVGEMEIYIFLIIQGGWGFFLYIVNTCQNSPLKRGLVSCKYQVHVKRADSFDYFFSLCSVSQALLFPRGLANVFIWKCWICSLIYLINVQ